jgi:hypothetical protein
MKGRVTKGAQYEGLRKLIRGLRSVASGEVLDRTMEKASTYLQGRVSGELARHVKTGTALRTGRVAVDSKALDVTLQGYYRYIRWSFKKGFPRSVLDRVLFIAAREYEQAMRGAK